MPKQTFYNLPPEKQERILNAAVEEFSKRNVREANLSNIISSAGISRGSLYQYFVGRDDIYVYMFDTLRAQRSAYVQPAFALYKKEPFIRFFEEFYMRDSEYLLLHPSHIELGKLCYGDAHGISRKIIQQIQKRYNDQFLVAIEFDKERGIISAEVDSSVLCDLCVHFVTDVFIFQSLSRQLSLDNVRSHMKETLRIIEKGISPRAD